MISSKSTTSLKLPSSGKEYNCFQSDGKSAYESQCSKSRVLTISTYFILKIESFEKQCVTFKGSLQSDWLKQHIFFFWTIILRWIITTCAYKISYKEIVLIFLFISDGCFCGSSECFLQWKKKLGKHFNLFKIKCINCLADGPPCILIVEGTIKLYRLESLLLVYFLVVIFQNRLSKTSELLTSLTLQ